MNTATLTTSTMKLASQPWIGMLFMLDIILKLLAILRLRTLHRL